MQGENLAGQAIVSQSVRPILATLAETSLDASAGVAVQVWLTGPGDICADCPRRPDCPDPSSCLHLASVAGALEPADIPVSRLPLGTSPIGRVPGSGEALVERDKLVELGVADPSWLRRSGTRAVVALPLQQGRRVLGVLVAMVKSKPTAEQVRSLGGAARLAAEAIGNVEAYRTLAAERNRLAARNARLQSARVGGPSLGLPEEPAPAAAASLPAPGAPAAPAATVSATPGTPAAAGPPVPATADALAATGAMLQSERFTLPPLRSFAQIQREGILHALERAGWRVSGPRGAAAALGLKPTTLESKMKRLGIRRPR
jgi:hypothetical protein